MVAPTYEEMRQILVRHFLLGKLSGNEIDTLLHYTRVERYPAGTEIFSKGSAGSSMMIVLRGTVKMSIADRGREVVFNVMYPDDVFGEMALLDDEARSTDAVAMTDCELLVLDRRNFMPILQKRADICLNLLRVLSQRLRQTTEQVEDLLFRTAGSRIAKALLRLAESANLHGVPGSGSLVELHLSQRDVASFAGGSLQSVNTQLQTWHREGVIELSKGAILIRDIAAIRRSALNGDEDRDVAR
jgi:CRP/FNR family transcriptional regulator, cyclic AMP receptor protein